MAYYWSITGKIRAQVLENGNAIEVSTTKLIEDTATELPFTLSG